MNTKQRLIAFIGLVATQFVHAFDVTVGDIHVTQGIQHGDEQFWRPLVAKRSVAIRVHVECLNGSPGPVSGNLKVYIDGSEVTPSAGISDINNQFPNNPNGFVPTCGRISDVQYQEEDMLTFEIIAPDWLQPARNKNMTNNMYFQVELVAPGDTNTNNNSKFTQNLTLIKRTQPRFYKIPIDFHPDGGTPATVDPNGTSLPGNVSPDPQFIAPGVGDVMVPAVWPVSDVEPFPPGEGSYWDNHLFPPLLSPLNFTIDCNNDDLVNDGPGPQAGCPHSDLPVILRNAYPRNVLVHEFDVLLAYLMTSRFMIIEAGVSYTDSLFLYGWLADGNLFGAKGYALTGGFNVGFGIDNQAYGQMAIAHEFGHMSADIPHNSPGTQVQENGWDVGARLHNNPNPMPPGMSGRVKPRNPFLYDALMNPTPSPTHNTWINLDTYDVAQNHPRLEAQELTYFLKYDFRKYNTRVIQGIPGRDPEGRMQMVARVMTYPWASLPMAEPENPNIEIQLTVEDPFSKKVQTLTMLAAARGYVETEKDHRKANLAPFALPVSLPKDAKVLDVQIRELEEEAFIVNLKPSASTPRVEVYQPQPSTTLKKQTTLYWEGMDSDGDDVSYQVAYSPDGGNNFIPLLPDTRDNKMSIDVRQLPKTEEGRGLIRVFVNDGFNTSFTDVSGLSVEQ